MNGRKAAIFDEAGETQEAFILNENPIFDGANKEEILIKTVIFLLVKKEANRRRKSCYS